ncbi:hypothetical protein SAMN04487939_101717 [Lysobacter sp. yr284]|uniref:hypothetical protein n=1 Tax=Lysobacter sp. yr284 TaxID=1761791 RepID=UPI00089B390B|nr:hypothetical protein [Lysobacter sp. yr284]SDY30241.1 hypothetical protein SAMN04487939_101717 [Lysobacter sp. yr284]
MATTVQRLRIGRTAFAYATDGAQQRAEVAEIFIDERPLAHWLGIARDLGNADTDLETQRPLALVERGRAAFLGLQPAHNQFGSGRLVLYRCHCGSDYCGTISCVLEVDGDHVVWRQVTLEDDNGPMSGADPGENAASSACPPGAPLRFVFDRDQYRGELERHFTPRRS